MEIPKSGDMYRHIARGSVYRVIDTGCLQTANEDLDNKACVVYQGILGDTWVRPLDEFTDGRFTKIS